MRWADPCLKTGAENSTECFPNAALSISCTLPPSPPGIYRHCARYSLFVGVVELPPRLPEGLRIPCARENERAQDADLPVTRPRSARGAV